MTNVEIVKKAYSDFATGNIEGALAQFDPQIEWHECKGMPFIKGDGIFVGVDAVVTNIFMNLPVYYDGFKISPDEIFGADDKVVMMGHYEGTNKATGNEFKANATHIWTVRNGKLSRFFQAADTAAMNV